MVEPPDPGEAAASADPAHAGAPRGGPDGDPAHRDPAHRDPAHRDPAHRDPAPAAPDRGVDPLAEHSPRALRRLARAAHRARHADVDRFERLSARTGIPLRQLRLLADAWMEGGASGVAALGPAPRSPQPQAVGRAETVIETWRRRHFPLDTLRVDTWRNRVTVWWLVPGSERATGPETVPLLQVRVTGEQRWHLFRKAAQGEWWPVRVRGRRARRQSLSACLDVVRADVANEFWSARGAAGGSAGGATAGR